MAENNASHPQEGPFVNITINAAVLPIHRGHETVEAIKKVGGVPLTDELEQDVDHKLVPLADDGAVTIKGGEIFISHVKDGRSS